MSNSRFIHLHSHSEYSVVEGRKRIADVLGIDLIVAAHAKMDLNAQKYPADRVRGSNAKYTEY